MSCELKTFAKLNLHKVQQQFGLGSEERWLNSVYYSISPTGESMVLAHGTKLVYMESKFIYERQENIFDVCWSCELDIPDLITSVLCIPLIGQMSGSQNSTDWTCLVIGTSSGSVLFYTDSRYQLMIQQWHPEPVTELKAQSGKHINEELHIFYGSCVCIVEGHNVFPVLRTLRQQYIKCK